MTKLDRRRFLKLGAQSALATGLASSATSLAAQTLADVDVIVIGAGISGLAAAQKLKNLGYEVLLLEASDRIGGRLLTNYSLNVPVEIGAGWIHGPRGNPISKLAKDVGGKTLVTDDESFITYTADGELLTYQEVSKARNRLQSLYEKIDDRFDGDQALSKAIKRVSPKAAKDPLLNWMFSAYTEFDTGGPIEKLSAYYFDEDEAYDGADVILTTGYDKILKLLTKGLNIRLNTPVDLVEYEAGDGATVYSNSRAFESSFVVCTIPLGVLQSSDVKFDPPLPKKTKNRIGKIGMGNVTKLALKFEQPHWPLDVQYFGLMTQEKGRWNYWLNYRKFTDENVLLGLCVGDYAGKVEKLSDGAMIQDAMKAVRTMFGSNFPDPVAHVATKWSRNPYSKGAYTYSKTGVQPSDFDKLSTPVRDVIVFAGEHTTFKHHATVHGAYLSGLRAAEIMMMT